MLGHVVKMGAIGAVAIALLTGAAGADSLKSVIEKGKLVVGVKTDYPPWGMRDKDGKIVGMEIDMANDIAKRVSAKAGKPIAVELVSVVASNRMQFLQQGQIDLMIATMNDKPERRKAVGVTLPNYYASGVTVMAKKDAGIKDWTDLKGKNICTIQGAWYNKDWGDKHEANLIAFPGTPEARKGTVGWALRRLALRRHCLYLASRYRSREVEGLCACHADRRPGALGDGRANGRPHGSLGPTRFRGDCRLAGVGMAPRAREEVGHPPNVLAQGHVRKMQGQRKDLRSERTLLTS